MKRYEIAKGDKKSSRSGDKRDSIYNTLKNTVKKLFEKGLLNNPRRVERIINKLVLLEQMKSMTLDNTNISLVLLMLILKEHFPDIFNLLDEEPDYHDLCYYIDMSKGRGNSPHKLKSRENRAMRNNAMDQIYINNYAFYETLQFFYGTKGHIFPGNEQKFVNQMMGIKENLDILG